MSVSERILQAQQAALQRGEVANAWRKPQVQPLTADGLGDFKAQVYDALFERLGSRLFEATSEEQMQTLVMAEIGALMDERESALSEQERQLLVNDIARDVMGLGPIEQFLNDVTVSEVMVNGSDNIYVERSGIVERTNVRFSSEEHLRRVIERIVSSVGRRVDESSPMVDARLADGSRVNVIVPPLSLDGSILTIRKFAKDPFTVRDLTSMGTLTEPVASLLAATVEGGMNILVSGGTGTGKTTLLNVLSSFVPHEDRIVTIEDAVELQLHQDHVIRLEARPPNIEGNGQITIRDLVRNALRMRPDRIIIGEVRGAEALDMLQAMNTGHDGSLTTVHANAPRDALARLETMVLMAGFDLPTRAIREQIASALNLIVQIERARDGTRRISHLTEVVGMEGDIITLQDIYRYDYKSMTLAPTGVRPEFVDKMSQRNVAVPDGLFAGPDAWVAMKIGRRLLVPLVASAAVLAPFGGVEARPATDDVEVILAIDASGSMRPAIEAAKTAANEFVASMPPDIRIGVETFSDTVTVLTPPTTDRALLAAQIGSIVADGDTALYDLVVTAGGHFTPAVANKVLVVLSDGRDEGSSATLADAVAAAEDLHVEAISLTTAETDLESLTALGQVTSAEDAAGVSAAFARVASLIVEVIEPTVPSSTAPATTAAPATTVAPATTIVAAATPSEAPPAPATPATTSSETSSTWLWLGGAGLFAGLFLITALMWPRQRVSKARLGIDKPRSVSDIGVRTVSAVEATLERYGKRTDLGIALAVADISMKPAEFVATVAIVAVVAGLVGLLLGGPILGLLVAAAVCLAVRIHVGRTKAKRQAAFAEQLPDVLQLVTTALRSGYGLTQALESVSEEAEEPARSEFAHVLVEVRLGRDLSDSMRALAQRMGNIDLEWVVSAIDINRDTGGNLSEVLQRVSETIRERDRLARQVRTLTAEGRLSARILIAMPLLMLLWQWRANPDNFDLLTHGVGLACLVLAGILMIIGSVWVHKIVNSVAY